MKHFQHLVEKLININDVDCEDSMPTEFFFMNHYGVLLRQCKMLTTLKNEKKKNR